MSFSRAQEVALVREIDAASSLFRHGFAILAEYRFALRDAEAVFACLAGGVEKLLKLSFGLATIDDGNPWPTAATMKNVGHRIVALDATVRGLLVQRRARSTAPGLIAELLERTDGHLGIGQMLGTLERYADQGRFYNLDLLGDRAQGGASPHELWEELHKSISKANPEIFEQLAGPECEAARRSINDIIASSLGLWCELLIRSWVTGVCGDVASRLGGQLELGHPRPA
jgi:hypothetical protein